MVPHVVLMVLWEAVVVTDVVISSFTLVPVVHLKVLAVLQVGLGLLHGSSGYFLITGEAVWIFQVFFAFLLEVLDVFRWFFGHHVCSSGSLGGSSCH